MFAYAFISPHPLELLRVCEEYPSGDGGWGLTIVRESDSHHFLSGPIRDRHPMEKQPQELGNYVFPLSLMRITLPAGSFLDSRTPGLMLRLELRKDAQGATLGMGDKVHLNRYHVTCGYHLAY